MSSSPITTSPITNEAQNRPTEQFTPGQVTPGQVAPGQVAPGNVTSGQAREEQLPNFDEKREFPRVPFRGRAKAVVFPVSPSAAGTTLQDSEVVTSDLSSGGVSILNRKPLVPGQQLMLMLNDRSQLAEVRWCCPVWDGLFAAGCRFLGEPGTTDIDQQLMAIDVVISNEESWWQPDNSA